MKDDYYELKNISMDRDNIENIIVDINHIIILSEAVNFMSGNNINHTEVIKCKYNINIKFIFILFKIIILYPFKLVGKRCKYFVLKLKYNINKNILKLKNTKLYVYCAKLYKGGLSCKFFK